MTRDKALENNFIITVSTFQNKARSFILCRQSVPGIFLAECRLVFHWAPPIEAGQNCERKIDYNSFLIGRSLPHDLWPITPLDYLASSASLAIHFVFGEGVRPFFIDKSESMCAFSRPHYILRSVNQKNGRLYLHSIDVLLATNPPYRHHSRWSIQLLVWFFVKGCDCKPGRAKNLWNL